MLAGACVGLGFEAKMAAALMVVPGIAAAWLWIAPRGRVAAVRGLLAGGAAMVAVGGAWPLLVALTPAADRPWVSGTSDNSIWSLILGYNGLGRLFGQSGGPGGTAGGPGGGGPGGLFGGEAGPLRLLNQALGSQAGWLLGFALVAGIAVLVATRARRTDARTGWLIAVGGAFATTAVAFSHAQGIFHPYYVSLLAPFTALLVGAGVARMLERDLAMRVLGPLAIAAGVVVELKILRDNPGQLGWLPALLGGGGTAAAVVLATVTQARLRAAAVAAVLGLLLLAPATWAAQTLGHATSGTFPAGGPASSGMGPVGGGPPGGFDGRGPGGPQGGRAMFGGDSGSLSAAVAYARSNGGGTVAVSSQSGAAGQVIASGADVAAIGGFSGRESQVGVSWLADAVESGRVRWVLTDGSGGGMPQDGRIGASDVMATAASACAPVSSVSGLYDCSGSSDALRSSSAAG